MPSSRFDTKFARIKALRRHAETKLDTSLSNARS